MIRGEKTRVTIFASIAAGGFGVIGLFRELFDVSSTKAALRQETLTTYSLPFSGIVKVLFEYFGWVIVGRL